ncbi:MAG: HD domain-containing protein [Gemmatimonadetes bacterium]|nr:HD domain-containing protein [Gemmatimonadota bacterium]
MDRLKQVLRRTWLTDSSRQENSAEHSWHVALIAHLLAEHAPDRPDVSRVIRMLLVHDIVEIDAGDTFAYDAEGHAGKAARERAAADRIFGLLPADQAAEWHQLWDEFEACETVEARYAHAIDRIQPLLQNVYTRGGAWRSHGVTREQIVQRMSPIEQTTPGLWPYVIHVIDEVWAHGWIRSSG